MIKNLQEKLKFIEFVDQMKYINRTILLKNGKDENDAEHSFHLAMMVIAFSEDFPELDIKKCLEYALIHDIVEIYAGDTVALDKKNELTKEKREREALEKIEKEYGKILPNFIVLLKEYEKLETKEAKFVYSLDKIQPIIQIVNEGGKTWHKRKFDTNKIIERQYSKIFPEFGLDKILDIYFEKAEKENMGYYPNKS